MTPLRFNAEHDTVLLAATREAFSLEEEGGGGEVAVDAADGDGPSAAAGVRKISHRNKTRAAALFAGVATLLAALYAARRIIVPF